MNAKLARYGGPREAALHEARAAAVGKTVVSSQMIDRLQRFCIDRCPFSRNRDAERLKPSSPEIYLQATIVAIANLESSAGSKVRFRQGRTNRLAICGTIEMICELRRILRKSLVLADDGKGLGSALSQLAPVLDAIDIAVKPDRRYGGGTATLESPICVFRAKGGAPIEAERPEYRIMRTITDVRNASARPISARHATRSRRS
jgi:hypothetical protein